MKSPIFLLSQPLLPDGDPGLMDRRDVVGALVDVRRMMDSIEPRKPLIFTEVNASWILLELVKAMKLTTLETAEALGAELALDVLFMVGSPEDATLEEYDRWWDNRIEKGPTEVTFYD